MYEFIVNPKARSGMGRMIWNRLEPGMKKRRVDYRVYYTQRRHHAGQIAQQLTKDGKEHTIVVLGGDGTVNEVVNGICSPEKVTFGYIPIGSSNDFARGLKLEKNPERALEMILSPARVAPMDIGVLERGGKTTRFLVSAGMGFDAAVCHEVCVSRWKVLLNRIGLGKLSYAVVAIHRILADQPVRVAVTLQNGKKQIFEKTWFAAFMNLPCEGGGFRFCPGASAQDGKLDIMVAWGMSKFRILCLLPLAFGGWHTRFHGITILPCSWARIEAELPQPLHTDGEPGFLRRKTEVKILEEKLRVIIE